MKTKLAALLVSVLTVASCSPQKSLTDMFFPANAAPWETVDAFYYPDRTDLTVSQKMPGVAGLAGCREIVHYMATVNKDPQLLRGDYECGVGRIDNPAYAGINVYRLTAR